MEIKASKSRFKGTAIVETALVLPILLWCTLGVIQYSWLFLKAQQITNAARSGARAAVRYGATTGDVTLAVTNALLTTGVEVDFTPPLTLSDINPGTGNEITVKLTSTSSVRLLDISLLPTPTELHASVTMAKEGP